METIKNILIVVFGAISSIVSFFAVYKNRKAKTVTTAKTEAEAEIDLIEKMEEFSSTTEKGFEAFDKVAKSFGSKCSTMKQEWVLMKLQNYAYRMGYAFDLDKWTAKVDKFIEATKTINSK